MSDITLVLSDFRQQFPLFETTPDEDISVYFGMASDYIGVANYGVLKNNSRSLALYLLTAHLLTLSNAMIAGDLSGTITNASEGSVSVALLQPTVTSDFKFWLNQSAYGQQLLALLSAKAAFGFYVGGSFALGNIRKANGNWS